MLSKKTITNSISELCSLCKNTNDYLVYSFSGEIVEHLNELFAATVPMQYEVQISKSAVMDIEEKVKNTILEWTLKLEKEGIVGENMTFSNEEELKAASIPSTVNNYYVTNNIVNTSNESVQILSGINNISFYSVAMETMKEVEKGINESNISGSDKKKALKLVSDLKKKLEDKKSVDAVKKAIAELKDFLIKVGANVAAEIIQSQLISFL